MHTKRWVALAALTAMLLGGGLHALPASATPGTAAIVATDPVCVGDTATLTWDPPTSAHDLVGFEITRQDYNGVSPSLRTVNVGPERRSLDFDVSLLHTSFLVRTVTTAGMAAEPFATAGILGSQPPRSMEWDYVVNPADVGDGSATVRFRWAGPVETSTTGGTLPVSVRITASSGVTSGDIPVTGSGVSHTFAGLTNGQAHTFTASTSNACGSSSSVPSATYLTGIRPTWVQAEPPLAVKKNKPYSHQFAASGTPAPTYSLRDAPPWLSITPDGVVSGRPPKDEATFSFSVAAENGVGIDYPGVEAPAVAGPFTVTVVKGWRDH
jgi:hypothetical protein